MNDKNLKSLKWTLGSLLVAGAFAGSVLPAQGKPARREAVTVTQPDGSTLSIMKRGDERGHLTLTADGILLVEEADGFYYYAEAGTDGAVVSTGIPARDAAIRPAMETEMLADMRVTEAEIKMLISSRASRNAVRRASASEESATRSSDTPQRGPGLCSTTFPSYGVQKGLVILVEYQDVKFGARNNSRYSYNKYMEGATAHDYFNDLLNKEGFDGFGGTGSARDFFLDNSRGTDGESYFKPQFDLYGPVTLPEDMSYYGGNDWSGDDKNPQMMAIHACQILDPDVEFSEYDRDGDGYVDNIYIIYAGYGEADGGPASSVWPHSWSISSLSGQVLYDGVRIKQYACSNETDFARKGPDGIGTFVHEFSHVMGLPDLYETTYSTGSYTPGEWSTLDYGPYNNEGRTPPNYSAYERYALGWISPREIGEEGEYDLTHIADSNDAIIIKTEKENEFYLAENRQQKGWDAYIPGHGMLLWHVDFKKSIFDANTVNNDPNHQYVDLIEANGRKSDSAASGHPFPGTAEIRNYNFKSWAKVDTEVAFSDISETPEGIITFHAKNGKYTGTGIVESIGEDTGAEAEYYNLQGIRVAEPRKGQLLIRKAGSRAEKIVVE